MDLELGRQRKWTDRHLENAVSLDFVRQGKAKQTEILCQDILRRMGYPVVQVESCASRIEVAIVKGEQVLVLIVKALNDMRFAFRKVPNITFVESIDFIPPILVDGCYKDLALVDIAPLRLHKGRSAMEFGV